VNLITGYIKIKKIKSLYKIEALDNAKSYRKILIKTEYYELIKAVFVVIADIIAVALIFLFFSKEISSFIGNITASGFIKPNLIKYSVLIFVFFRTFEFILRLIRYNSIKNLKESDSLAEVNQEYVLILRKLDLIKILPGISTFLLLGLIMLSLMGMPLYILLIFTGFILLPVLLSIIFGIIGIKRIKKISFDDNKIDQSVVKHKIEQYENEKITGKVFGIMIVNTDFKDVKDAFNPIKILKGALSNPYSSSFLGSGKVYYPENTLLITNKRLLFIQIPMTGGNKVVEGINYSYNNLYFNRGELIKNGEEILKTNSLPQILKLAINDVLYQDINSLTLKKQKNQIIIEKSTGEKLGYSIVNREMTIEPSIKKLFKLYLKEKFIEE